MPILILVHGFAGNKEENGLFAEAEKFFSQEGFNVFRFDFEGAGMSEGDYILTSLSKQVDDLRTAIDYLESTYKPRKVAVVGFSLGATVAILGNDPRIDAYAFWSPALNPSTDMFPRYNSAIIKREFRERGFLEKAGLRVGYDIIEELKGCKLHKYIQRIDKPVILIHGTFDDKINYKTTQDLKNLFPTSKFRLIRGANHSYRGNSGHRKILYYTTLEFLRNMLK
jgi:pimeloyl-ACP methyl ester carboxylesterase